MVMIFGGFRDLEQTEAFVSAVKERFGVSGRAFADHEVDRVRRSIPEGQVVKDPIKFGNDYWYVGDILAFDPPLALIERAYERDGIEEAIRRLAAEFGSNSYCT